MNNSGSKENVGIASNALEQAWQVDASQFDTGETNCIRTTMNPAEPVIVENESTSRWGNFFRVLTSESRLVFSGRFALVMQVTPIRVRVYQNQWSSVTGKFGRGVFRLPIYDEISRNESVELKVRCWLPFLHPFVPMHIEVSVDGEVVFAQGRFAK